jgi:hypothetical protein
MQVNDLILLYVSSQLKMEELVRTLWITSFGRGYGPVVRKGNRMNDCTLSS